MERRQTGGDINPWGKTGLGIDMGNMGYKKTYKLNILKAILTNKGM